MTATACKWVLDLYKLKVPSTGKSFLVEFATYMVKQTDGWQSEGWVEVATWASMPEVRVGLHAEVELWTRWAEPHFHFGRRHFQGPDGLPGHGIREVVKHQHEHVRPMWANARQDYKFLLPSAGKCAQLIDDPTLRAETEQLLQEAVNAGADEMDELFSCHYESWMLLLWMWHPKYTSSAARALASLLGIQGSTPPDDSALDQMFKTLFDEEDDAVLAHWDAWDVGFDLDDEIKKMCDHVEIVTAERMAQLYPVYNKLLHDIVDSLAFTDVICEITFSHSKSTLRHNMSDPRHDNDLQWVHNVLYKMRKVRRENEDKRRSDKGLVRRIGVSTTKMRPETCVFAGEQLVKLQQRYAPDVMKSLKVPSSSQLRRNKKLRVRCIEQAKSKRSVQMLQESNKNRRKITPAKFIELMQKNRAKNVNAKKWRDELIVKAEAKTLDGKVRFTIKRILSTPHWCSSRVSVRDFRLNLRLFFPSYTRRLDNLFAELQAGSLTAPIKTLWTKTGLISKSAITSKTLAGGVYGIHSYLDAVRTSNFTQIPRPHSPRQTLIPVLRSYGCSDEELTVWYVCSESPYIVRLLKIATYVDRDTTKSYRRKKMAAIGRMKSITTQVGAHVAELPLMINKGDVCVSSVVGFNNRGRPTVRVFLEVGAETLVLCDSPKGVKAGDELVVEVSNTSGGRKCLQAKSARTLALRDRSFSTNKPVLVLRVVGLLGRLDFTTGYFLPRPGAVGFLLFAARLYNLAVWTVTEGECIQSKILLMHPLLFMGVGDVMPEPASMTTDTSCELSISNVVRLVPEEDDTVGDGVLTVSRYQGGSKDDTLLDGSALRSLLAAAAATDAPGLFISEYNDE